MTSKSPALPVLVVLSVALAAGLGYVIGRDGQDDQSGQADASPSSDCAIVQVPVSDHVEGQCIPEAASLLAMFDVQSTPPGPTADGWVVVGELWLDQDATGTGQTASRLCWVNSTDETRCTS